VGEIDWIEAARRILPAWVGWAYWIWLPLYALAAWIGASLARWLALRGVRPAADLHWTERARAAHPATAAGAIPIVVAVMSGFFVHRQLGPLSNVYRSLFGILVGATCYLAALLRMPGMIARTFERPVRYAEIARSHLTAWVLIAPMIPLGLVIALLLPTTPSSGGFLLLGLGLLLCVAACWGWAIPLATLMGVARPAGTRLSEIVSAVSRRMNVPVTGVHEIGLYGSNAAALPLPRALLFTERALEVLSDAEIAAICAHELGHVAEPRSVALSRVVPVVYVYLAIAASPWLGHAEPIHWLGFGIGGLLLMVAVPPLVRRFERGADAAGLAHEDVPGIYAAALEKIGRDNLTPAVMPGRAGSHPHLYDRLLSSDRPPSYPRPAPPSTWRAAFVFALGVAPTAAIFIGAATARSRAEDANALVRSLAFLGGDANDLGRLGWLRSDADDSLGAATFFSAASVLRPGDVYYPAEAAYHWSRIERCPEAKAHLQMARQRLAARPTERRENAVQRTADWVTTMCPAPR